MIEKGRVGLLREVLFLLNQVRININLNIISIYFGGLFKSLYLNKIFYYPFNYQLRDLTKGMSKEKHDPLKSKILIAPVSGFGTHALNFESVIGTSLRKRGHLVEVLKCNKSLLSCAWNIFGTHKHIEDEFERYAFSPSKNLMCENCSKKVDNICDSYGVNTLNLYDFFDSGDYKSAVNTIKDCKYGEYRDFVYKGVPVGEHAYSTYLRTRLRGDLSESEFDLWIYKRLLLSSIIYVDELLRMFAEKEFDVVVATHGLYIEHGALMDVAKSIDIRVVIYGFSYRNHCVHFSHQDTYHREMMHEDNSVWKNYNLSDDEIKKIDGYIKNKDMGHKGGVDVVVYNEKPLHDWSAISQHLGLDSGKKKATLYTNVLWDAQIYYSNNPFMNIVDWIIFTINQFSKLSEWELIIRIHPAESKIGYTQQPIKEEIMRHFDTLPKNIKIVNPESSISSYVLAKNSSLALVYASNIALEIATTTTPVVVCGEAFCRGKGFTHDVNDINEYVELIKNIDSVEKNSDKKIRLALQYAHHWFFRRMIFFPLIKGHAMKNNPKDILTFDQVNFLAKGRNKNLDLIIDGIVDGKPFIAEEL